MAEQNVICDTEHSDQDIDLATGFCADASDEKVQNTVLRAAGILLLHNGYVSTSISSK
jgi:hypothetical protein